MSTLAINAVWETIITIAVATGVNDVYVWHPAVLPIPAIATTYTVEGLRVVEVNPTELIIGGATQSTSADQTLIAGGPPITLPSGKDWLPQTITLGYNSAGNSLYLGPRISTDTYPPHIEVTVTNIAIALPTLVAPTATPDAETQASATPSSASSPGFSFSSSRAPSTTTAATQISTGSSMITSLSSSVSTSSPLSSSFLPTTSATSVITPTLALITFTRDGPALPVPTSATTFTTTPFPLTSSNHSTGFTAATGTGIGGLIINPFQGTGVGTHGGNWSIGCAIASMVLGVGLGWRLWT
ncbi:mucin 12, cell surface associated [Xylographa vitiligo]|nr:mucin 12, cell surface associated [Xylographa vitiligo]